MENQKHNHTKCEHKELKYCSICDVVYCLNPNCNEEWKKETYNWTITAPNWQTGTTLSPYPRTKYHSHQIN